MARGDRRRKAVYKPHTPRAAKLKLIAAADKAMLDASVEPIRHGEYEVTDFKLIETVEGGKVKEHATRVIRNKGGTPVERWHRHGVLDDRQVAAIMVYTRAWHLCFQAPRVTSNWGEVVSGCGQGGLEVYAANRFVAKETLRLLDNDVFFILPRYHFEVFQNVVIFDEPAGVAGGRAGFVHKPAETAARVIVSTVASMIANIVIDGARRDFDLPQGWDIDTPRKRRA